MRRVLVALSAGAVLASSAVTSPPVAAARPSEWDTWFLNEASELRIGSPPADNSEKTRDELDRLLRMQKRRTDVTKRRVHYWRSVAPTIRWTQTALKMIRKHRPGRFPTMTTRALALLHLGMYDAYAAAADSRGAYFRPRPRLLDARIKPLLRRKGSSYPDKTAAVAGAAEQILAYLFPNEPPETFHSLADRAATAGLWAGINYPSDVRRGRRLGRLVADRVIAYAENDGYAAPWDFETSRPCSTSGCSGSDEHYWIPTPPSFQYPPTDPMASRRATFLVSSADALRPGPPPAYGSAEFLAELAEVKAARDNATDQEQALAYDWDDGPGSVSPAGHWNVIALQIVSNRNATGAETARTFAYMNAAIHDAVVAAWDAKYHYWSIRPVTAMRRETIAGVGNPSFEDAWTPLIPTPPFPAYVSGHSTMSAAAARVLQFLFPDGSAPPPGLADAMGPAGTIDQIAEEVAHSRLVAGIHFSSDNEEGLKLGRKVAAEALRLLAE